MYRQNYRQNNFGFSNNSFGSRRQWFRFDFDFDTSNIFGHRRHARPHQEEILVERTKPSSYAEKKESFARQKNEDAELYNEYLAGAVKEARTASNFLMSNPETTHDTRVKARRLRDRDGQVLISENTLPFVNSRQAADALDMAYQVANGDPQRLKELENNWRATAAIPRGRERDTAMVQAMTGLAAHWQAERSTARPSRTAQSEAAAPKRNLNSVETALSNLQDGDKDGRNDKAAMQDIAKYLRKNGTLRTNDPLDTAINKMDDRGFVHDLHAVDLIAKYEAFKQNKDDPKAFAALYKSAYAAANESAPEGGKNIGADKNAQAEARAYLATLGSSKPIEKKPEAPVTETAEAPPRSETNARAQNWSKVTNGSATITYHQDKEAKILKISLSDDKSKAITLNGDPAAFSGIIARAEGLPRAATGNVAEVKKEVLQAICDAVKDKKLTISPEDKAKLEVVLSEHDLPKLGANSFLRNVDPKAPLSSYVMQQVQQMRVV